ncbi:hypothetical protein GCM10010305_41260 [Streptomyces termitum]|uniref:Uncharacterized protein n=1 Tax=Streptomyces termitum TaxID=67368 RepID=A0A918T648_9ACTN|nr:hypothetical protein GCM10010305_41260 [Streptomyces termitum]
MSGLTEPTTEDPTTSTSDTEPAEDGQAGVDQAARLLLAA